MGLYRTAVYTAEARFISVNGPYFGPADAVTRDTTSVPNGMVPEFRTGQANGMDLPNTAILLAGGLLVLLALRVYR